MEGKCPNSGEGVKKTFKKSLQLYNSNSHPGKFTPDSKVVLSLIFHSMTNDLYLRDMNQYPVFLIFLKPFDTTNDHVAMVINTEDIKYNEHNCCYSYEKIFLGILTWSGVIMSSKCYQYYQCFQHKSFNQIDYWSKTC